MTEDLITRMYRLLDDHPESDAVAQFELECSSDMQLQQIWHDFLVEQYLSGHITDAWKKYILHIPQLNEHLAFQRHVQKGIRTLQDRYTRAEIRRVLPKRPLDDINTSGRGPRFIVLVSSIAAVALLGIGVLLTRFWNHNSISNDEGGVPIVMVEAFESDGVTEDMLVHGIPQRIPSKLAATEGIYPLTSFAVDHATRRAHEGEQPQELLNASYSLRGKIRRQGDAFLVEASLLDVAKNHALWKEIFTVADNAKAIDDMQDQLSLRVVHELNVAVSADAEARLTMDVSNDLDAVDLFLAGERKWDERTDTSLQEAIQFFRMALEHDSTSTIIRGYLALVYATYAEADFGDSTYWLRAVEEADRVLLLDPSNPESLIVKGDYAEQKEKDYIKAEQYFNKALHVQPGDAKIHQAIAELCLRTGDIALGKDHILIARAIEPEQRVVRWVETKYLTASGDLEGARIAADDLMKMYPTFPYIQNFYWQYYLSKGEHEQALRSIRTDTEQWRQDYIRCVTFIDQSNDAAFDKLYPQLRPELKPSLDLLRYVQKDHWDNARKLLDMMLSEDRFGLLALFQTSDFAIFNKMKQDPGIRQILTKYGIKVNDIPEFVEPEM